MSFVFFYTILWTYNALFYGIGIIQGIRAKKSTFGEKLEGAKQPILGCSMRKMRLQCQNC